MAHKRTFKKAPLIFVWHGGAYVDIYYSDIDTHPITNIGVWDYENDVPQIKSTADFHALCHRWYKENRGDLPGYIEAAL